MLLLLNAINYKKHGGQMCGYLKVTGLFTWSADGTCAILIFFWGGGGGGEEDHKATERRDSVKY
jgi:hypothetical protein